MIVNYEGHEYTLDTDEISVEEARTFKRYAGLSLRGWEDGLKDGDPEAMTCLYWLILRQNGQDHNIEKVTFKIVKLAEAMAIGSLEEAAKRALERDAASPKEESL